MPTHVETSVSELLAQARDGDPSALNRLFGACRNYLSLLAQGQVESNLQAKVDPSDLVQQTLLEAYHGFAKFHGGSEAEWLAWLRGILAHNALDCVRHYRGDKRQVRREVGPAGASGDSSGRGFFDPADTGETPSQLLIRRERELQLADAVAQLDPDQRTVVILRNLQRLPFEEVARQMNRSRPAVQMLWMRAIRKLQEIMPEDSSTPRMPP
jgi:RNA polymerase sigma-70 factor (ECF subfamily)